MACIKKDDERTHGWADNPKAICPINFFEVGGIINTLCPEQGQIWPSVSTQGQVTPQ